MSLHKIVLVGPTNVGKSALFNKLTHTRKAIVCDRPGVTVDRHEHIVAESPVGPLMVVDTGGVGIEARRHKLGVEIERAALVALKDASIVFFVVDGTRELGVDELEIASWLRKNLAGNTPVWTLVNKLDDKRHDPSPFYALGFDRVQSVSAEHGLGLSELWTDIEEVLGAQALPPVETEEKPVIPRVVILGRPNAGKSTLTNAILGEERHVVSEIPGTTRDPIESTLIRKGIAWTLIDTAGLRQPGRLERDVEWVAREKLKDQAQNSDVAVVVIDASQGVTDLDAAICGMATDFGLSVVVAFNKWDKMSGPEAEDLFSKFERSQDLKLEFLRWTPWIKMSALTGQGLKQLTTAIQEVMEARKQRVQTSKLNRLFEKTLRHHHHPMGPANRPAKFYYLSQVSANPPEFVLFSNLPGKSVHFSYRRFIVNTLRDEFGFKGTPIKLHFKQAHNAAR
jgi:GTP-binding protein